VSMLHRDGIVYHLLEVLNGVHLVDT
jgi:hypothetical protein